MTDKRKNRSKKGKSADDSSPYQHDFDDKKNHDTQFVDANLKIEIESLKEEKKSLQIKYDIILAENIKLKDEIRKYQEADQANHSNSEVHKNAMEIEENSVNEEVDTAANEWTDTTAIPENSKQDFDEYWDKEEDTTFGNQRNERCYQERDFGYKDGNRHRGRQNELKTDNWTQDCIEDRQRGWREAKTFTNNTRRGKNQSAYSRNEFKRANIIEKDGDLFLAPQDHSLAHCVAADLRMGSGIAVQFKQKFKRVDELLGQRKKVGEVAVLEDENRYIYYLITKKYSTGKPTIRDLQDSLEKMREHVEMNKVKNISIPRLGCGLDRLHWRDVRELLNTIFANVDVTITVYNFTVDAGAYSQDNTQKKSSIYVVDKVMKLVDIESATLLVLFGSKCGHIDNAMQELDAKFRFSNEYKKCTKNLGDVISYKKQGEMICILIVKEDKNDFLSYPNLSECLKKLRKIFVREKYFYMGFTAFTDNNDDITVHKIVTLLKILFFNVACETWICWPQELKHLCEDYMHRVD